MGEPEKDLVLMATIGAAHGIRGEVRVKPHGEDPLSFTDYGPLVSRDGRSFEVRNARVQKTVVITKFKGVDDRNKAETLNGLDLFVPRERLPALDEDEFYYSDLQGLAVVTPAGEDLGKVIAVQDFGAGDLLEVRPKRGRSFYVPFTKAFVPSVDVAAGVVRVDLPDDYFSESEPDDGDGSARISE